MRVVEQQLASPHAAVATGPRRPSAPRQPPATADRHSRWVALLKVVLPVTGIALLCLVTVWPRLPSLLETVGVGFPAIDLREARELRMVSPRYVGVDRYNRPFIVTAAIGRQVPDRNDVIALERPRGVMTVRGGASVAVTAATGVYQSQAQLLDLFEDVDLTHQDGTRFVTQRAHVNFSDNTAEGRDPVEGHGPQGDITGEGFLILSKGETIIFTGQSTLLLKGGQAKTTAVAPPALPPGVAEAAEQIEAAAAVLPIVAPKPVVPAVALEQAAVGKGTAKLAARSKRPATGRHVTRASNGKPSVPQLRRHGG